MLQTLQLNSETKKTMEIWPILKIHLSFAIHSSKKRKSTINPKKLLITDTSFRHK
jgi:hypothetical protein